MPKCVYDLDEEIQKCKESLNKEMMTYDKLEELEKKILMNIEN